MCPSPACLQKFKHNDLISSVDFHPTDDRYFVSGCFDTVLRLWDSTKSAEPVRFKEVGDK
jgi:WD40 repeat protein